MTTKGYRRLIATILIVFSATLLSHGKNTGQGDEPHYMMISHSLLFDRDLDLRNNYSDPSNIIFAGNLKYDGHVREGKGGHLYSVHPFGLPLAFLPAFAAGYLTAAHVPADWIKTAHLTRWTLLRLMLSLAMILLTTRLALMIYDWHLKAGLATNGFAFLAIVLCFLCCPLLPLGFLFFTEMPAAFLAFFAIHSMAGRSMGRLLLRAGSATFLPFLHFKYLLLSLALLAFLVWEFRADRRKTVIVVTVWLAGELILGMVNFLCWDSIMPYASFGAGFHPDTVGLFGLFLDREFGLLWYSPIYLTAIPGALMLLSRDRFMAFQHTAVMLSLIIVAGTYPMWWGGWTPAARFLAPVIIFAIPCVTLALQASWSSSYRRAIAASLVTVQLIIAIYFWQRPKLMWNEADGYSEFLGRFQRWLPSLITASPRDYLLACLWAAVFVLIGMLLFVRQSGRLHSERPDVFQR